MYFSWKITVRGWVVQWEVCLSSKPVHHEELSWVTKRLGAAWGECEQAWTIVKWPWSLIHTETLLFWEPSPYEAYANLTLPSSPPNLKDRCQTARIIRMRCTTCPQMTSNQRWMLWLKNIIHNIALSTQTMRVWQETSSDIWLNMLQAVTTRETKFGLAQGATQMTATIDILQTVVLEETVYEVCHFSCYLLTDIKSYVIPEHHCGIRKGHTHAPGGSPSWFSCTRVAWNVATCRWNGGLRSFRGGEYPHIWIRKTTWGARLTNGHSFLFASNI